MFSYLFVALFTILSVSSHPVFHSGSSLAPCDSSSATATPSSVPVPVPSPSVSNVPTVTPSAATPATSVPSSSIPALLSTSPTPSVTPTSSPVPSPSTSVAMAITNGSNGPFYGGFGTYYYQNGNPGACGWYNPDSAFICAMDQARFGTSGPGSSLCGQQVQITNENNGQTITVTIADDCPTCTNSNSIDLSVAAFEALSALSVGEFPIMWSFV